MTPFDQKIGLKLRKCREALRYTKTKVADAIGVPYRQTMTCIETGTRKVSSEELAKLCRLYERPPEYFLYDESNDTPRTSIEEEPEAGGKHNGRRTELVEKIREIEEELPACGVTGIMYVSQYVGGRLIALGVTTECVGINQIMWAAQDATSEESTDIGEPYSWGRLTECYDEEILQAIPLLPALIERVKKHASEHHARYGEAFEILRNCLKDLKNEH